ncbi:gliding motility-associated C-terminal domain-containing protein [Solitalea sp. MAHUQ-68]|uniref:Gliding motility-associated C-terminal domain-containing protein n=1 Tax=Solitalea agri TaxID=2953739 RepID=A0A9X2F425_9SPHI|nr:gliding motility-associated C-terminal domain-containing protein [Solitalea agri]MCO4293795.1 gliding motility-associated C-terminal domain-containing protein [Solitalea agri]
MKHFYLKATYFILVFLSCGFLAKAQQPNLLWGTGIGGNLNDYGTSIAVDQQGNTFVTGSFNDVVSFGTKNITSKGLSDIFLAKYDLNGNLIWVKSFGSANSDEPKSLAIDGTGNVYLAGFISGPTDFNPPTNSAIVGSKGGPDLFIASFDNNGNYRWTYSAGNTGNDVANSIAIDKNNDVYLTGTFTDKVAFNPAQPTQLTGASNSADVYIVKYSNTGAFNWVINMGENGSPNIGYKVTVDNDLNAYITGELQGSVDFDPDPTAVATLTSKGGADVFAAKYDKDGKYKWAFSFGSNNTERGVGIHAGTDGYIYLTGLFTGTSDFNPSPTLTNFFTPIGEYDGFIAKYDADGNYVYAQQIGGTAAKTLLTSSAIDKDNNIYITGGFTSTVDFDAGPGTQNGTNTNIGFDVYLAKYDASGNYKWHLTMNGTGAYDQGTGVGVDQNGNSYLVGSYDSQVDLDPGTCDVKITSKQSDAFVVRYTDDITNLTDILAFSLSQQKTPAVINKASHTITVEVLPGTNVTNLTPTIVVSPCSTVSPASGTAKDFTNPVVYTVKDKFSNTQQWTVTVKVPATVTCSGRVTPIQVITLGTDANPLDLPGTTTYTRNESDPNDGSYGYFSTVPNVFGNAWHSGEKDHTTGDVNGRMLIFNASNAPGEFYRAPISGLCTNAIYRFSAFIANVLHKTRACSPDRPVNVTFEIRDKSNNIIDQVSTGDIYAANQMSWMEFGIDFTGQTEVVLVMRNNGPGGCGNDLAIDDISFSICGSIDISSDVPGASSTETFVCNGANVNLKSTLISGFVNPDFQWQSSADNKTWNNITGATTGSLALTNVQTTDPKYYRLIVAATGTINDPSSNCKVIASPFTVNVIGDPVIAADNNKTDLCQGEKTILRNTVGKARSYQWLLNGTNLADSFADTLVVWGKGSYSLKIINDEGCERVSNVIQIETRPTPDAKFSFIADCFGLFSFFDASSISDGSTLSYLWNFDDAASGANNTSTAKDPVHTYTTAGVKKVSLTVTSTYGCSKTFVYDVSVLGSNVKAAIQNLSVAPYCTNAEMVFKDVSTTDFGTITYRKWEIIDAANQVVKTVMNDAQINFTAAASTVSQTFKVRLIAGFSMVCTDIEELSFTIDPSPQVSLNLPVSAICINEPSFVLAGGMPLDGNGGTGVYTVDGVQQTSFSPQTAGAGEHMVRYTFKNSPSGCESYSEQKITVGVLPVIDCKDYTVVAGIDIELKITTDGSSGSGYKYQWTPTDGLSDPTIANPILSPTIDKTYQVVVTNAENCSATCTVNVTVLPKIEVNNVFTPNGDGKNDTWTIPGIESYPNMEVFIYDRFGSQVFHTKGYSVPWDGKYKNKNLPQGTYYYVLKPNQEQLSPTAGSVTIIY